IPKPAATAEPPRAMPVSNPPPAMNVETVQLPPEPVLNPAQDVPSNQSSETIAKQEGEPAKAPVSASHETPKSSKRTLLQRLNPLNLFGGDGKSSSSTSRSNDLALKEPMTVLEGSNQSFVRYAYVNPAKPESGNRSDAEKVFAKAVQAQQAQQVTE